ncbi:hypothetical protein IFM89_033527 [Coptis chinensis]|uniref:DNA primase large subunit C-terminal domain-containing protein n=1 Tax=Coptis chinensis TaxID=261450 RepID=A0A835HA83_9MAGN|nr:hypothetical protein IFM89_033527 [Coptis chinensis]
MTLEDALTLARAFSRYLNLMTIAETHHRVRKARNVPFLSESCDDFFNKLIHSGIAPEDLYDTVCKQVVEIVLTAHPTQINRRTLQYKHIRIAFFLYNRCLSSHSVLHIVEQSLWRAVPRYLRRVSNALKKVHTSAPGYLDLTEPHRTLRGLASTCNPSASEENLRAALSKMGVGGRSMEDVMEKVRNRHYQLACTLTFEAVHGTSCDAGINHPNQYFTDSQNILKLKNNSSN